MSIFDSMRINSSELSVERLKLDTISSNDANENTTRTEEGGPYQKKTVVIEESLMQKTSDLAGSINQKSFGVRATGIEASDEIVIEYNPTHPDADEFGYVTKSNVNMADEMVEMMNTIRTYEANVTATNASKSMLSKALEIRSEE